MNTVSIASIKRSGMNAIEAALSSGPAFVMKRNRAAAVIISATDYQDFIQSRAAAQTKPSAMDWLLKMPSNSNGLNEAGLAERLQDAKSGWNER